MFPLGAGVMSINENENPPGQGYMATDPPSEVWEPEAKDVSDPSGATSMAAPGPRPEEDDAPCPEPGHGDSAAFVGRQPIFDRKMRVYAYELLFRSSADNFARFHNDDQATAQVLVDTFMELGLEQVVGNRKACVNLSREFLLGNSFHLLPPERVCLEILEDVVVDDAVVQRAQELSERGYTIILDDFIYHEDIKPLIEIADIIKVDILEMDGDGIREQVRLLEGTSARLLAEKVENIEEFELCRDLGFSFFQGFFLEKPQVVKGRRMSPDAMAMMELLARVNSSDVTVEELQQIISRDASLSYLLLKYINSAFYALPERIESTQHALMLLGTGQVQSWVNLLLLSKVSRKPSELLVISMLRAKMCEGLAESLGEHDPQMFFTAGLLSILDALVDRPMDSLLHQLNLCDDLKQALIHREGPAGLALKCAIAYGRANWGDVALEGLPTEAIRNAWIEAVKWVSSVRSVVTSQEG